jgi:hypothetical protein
VVVVFHRDGGDDDGDDDDGDRGEEEGGKIVERGAGVTQTVV